ncbi:MAG: WYL domain-containing protein, partial [Bacteroidota bacterium]
SSSLSYMQMAIINFRVVDIVYQAKEKEKTHRKIEPLAIYSYNDNWILIAWCRLRNDYRAFRLDRIHHFKVLEEIFEDRNFELGDYFMNCSEINYNP